MDNQDKQAWCEKGERSEQLFIDEVAPLYGIDVVIHPDKATDKYATDMQLRNKTFDIDLKHKQTPFFTSSKFGVDPNRAVSFDHKDYIRYMYKYPREWSNGMHVIFWVDWKDECKYGKKVFAVSGLWSINIHQLDDWIRNGQIKCHDYQERQGGIGTNALSAWVIDLGCCYEWKLIKS